MVYQKHVLYAPQLLAIARMALGEPELQIYTRVSRRNRKEFMGLPIRTTVFTANSTQYAVTPKGEIYIREGEEDVFREFVRGGRGD